MKQFNRIITVEVSVDNIAQQLLSNINEDFKHRELLTESIIGSLLSDRNDVGISSLYNSLNGYTNEIDFEIGDEVIPEGVSTYTHIKQEDYSWKSTYVPVKGALVRSIDLYRSDKLDIEYPTVNSKGEVEMKSSWVKHTKCSKM